MNRRIEPPLNNLIQRNNGIPHYRKCELVESQKVLHFKSPLTVNQGVNPSFQLLSFMSRDGWLSNRPLLLLFLFLLF
jgi:hypothetical protein